MASSELENAEATKVIGIPFRVFQFQDRSTGRKSLKLVQPDDTCERKRKKGRLNYPSVSIKKEDPTDTYAFHIMQQINHDNILSLENMIEPNNNEEGSVSAIVSEIIKLPEKEMMLKLSDHLGNFRSKIFQKYIREIVCGIDFLREMGLYHGNLSWNAIYCTIVEPGGSSTLKLGDFKEKSEEMTLQDAQWNDVDSLIHMLERASTYASSSKKQLAIVGKQRQPYLGDLDALIQNLKNLKNSCLLEVKHKILENVFFWDESKRSELYVCTLPKLLKEKSKDEDFMKSIINLNICEFPWYDVDSNSATHGQSLLSELSVCADFQDLVNLMNKHQIKLGLPPFDPKSALDLLEFICGAYTHRHELNVDVDIAIRGQFPKACLKLKRLTDMYCHKES